MIVSGPGVLSLMELTKTETGDGPLEEPQPSPTEVGLLVASVGTSFQRTVMEVLFAPPPEISV
ncbi:hypothetical protein A0257_07225 [Hymenobacter psoromatis]|nr:hypothetical protein A0257_07225 [Hymenobacter psoromatis]